MADAKLTNFFHAILIIIASTSEIFKIPKIEAISKDAKQIRAYVSLSNVLNGMKKSQDSLPYLK